MANHLIRRITATAIAGLAAASIASGLAYASGGAGGGTFDCKLTGVPRWGYVTSSYYHRTRQHWATAIGAGRKTVEKPAGINAVATTGRALYGNHCYWGKR